MQLFSLPTGLAILFPAITRLTSPTWMMNTLAAGMETDMVIVQYRLPGFGISRTFMIGMIRYKSVICLIHLSPRFPTPISHLSPLSTIG
ncbi:hypothetical protein QL285_010368 [Trifolium repens]|nr:hypothetical protein QL285_010368 [Trifolium repens]